MLLNFFRLIGLGLGLGGAFSLFAATPNASRNIILIIGDGMDEQQITIARNYLKGARGQLTLDQMPVRASVQVLTVADDNPKQAVYVADSANSASTIATGTITSRGRIATSAKTDQDLTTIIELAQANGLKTGIVTTASVTDATPASFIAHISSRGCENPDMMSDALIYDRVKIDCSQDLKTQGGLGSIAEQLADSKVDIILGGGQKHFQPTPADSQLSVTDSAKKNGFKVITSKDQLQAAELGREKILGLFADNTLAVRLRGSNGRSAEKPEPSFLNYVYKYLGSVEQPQVMSCESNPEYGDTPSLNSMSQAALKHLQRFSNKGFFLVIESASIDKQSHKRQPCGSIGELQQLDETLASALKFAAKVPNTLIIVTADHGQAAQLIPDESLYQVFDVPIFSPGYVARVKTPEGSIMAINYATNNFASEEHTGVNVPLFSNNPGRDRIPTQLSQAELFELMAKYLQLETGTDTNSD